MPTRHRNQFSEKPLRFVTTTCVEWLPFLESDECKEIVAQSLQFVNEKYCVDLPGYVMEWPVSTTMELFIEGER